QGWRSGWLAVGGTVLIVGLLPNWLLMIRRPEDVGLNPDRRYAARTGLPTARPARGREPRFSRQESLRAPAFWLLSLYPMAVFPVQAGISLHQASYLIEWGLSPTIAATIISTFSLLSGASSLVFGLLIRRIGVRAGLATAGMFLAVSAI